MLVWSTFGAHPSAIAAFTPAQTNRTKRDNELQCDSTELNGAGVKAPLNRKNIEILWSFLSEMLTV